MLLILSMMGCGILGPSVAGDWSGYCDLVDESWIYQVPIEIDISDDSGGTISGEASFSIVEMDGTVYTFDGAVSGAFDKDDIEFEIETIWESESFFLEVDASLDADEISGNCTFGDLVGTVELSLG